MLTNRQRTQSVSAIHLMNLIEGLRREPDDARSSEIMGKALLWLCKIEICFWGSNCFHSQWVQEEDNVPQNWLDGGPGLR